MFLKETLAVKILLILSVVHSTKEDFMVNVWAGTFPDIQIKTGKRYPYQTPSDPAFPGIVPHSISIFQGTTMFPLVFALRRAAELSVFVHYCSSTDGNSANLVSVFPPVLNNILTRK
jgi:hypothetical protein